MYVLICVFFDDKNMYVCMYVCMNSTLMVNKAKAAIVQEAKKKDDLKQYHKNYQDRVYQVLNSYIHTYMHAYMHTCIHTVHTLIRYYDRII